MTNYEKIKNMSVEEMTAFINHIGNIPCMPCASKYCTGAGSNTEKCMNGISVWLNSEVEE